MNRDVPLVDNRKYPRIAEDYAQSFAVLKRLPCNDRAFLDQLAKERGKQ